MDVADLARYDAGDICILHGERVEQHCPDTIIFFFFFFSCYDIVQGHKLLGLANPGADSGSDA